MYIHLYIVQLELTTVRFHKQQHPLIGTLSLNAVYADAPKLVSTHRTKLVTEPLVFVRCAEASFGAYAQTTFNEFVVVVYETRLIYHDDLLR